MEWHRPARPEQQHAHNLALVSRLVASDGPVSRAMLAQRSGLTKTTVTQLTGELIDAGLVRELGLTRTTGPGRPASQLVMNATGPVGVGLQIEADHVAGCVFDLAGRVRDRALRRADDLRGDPPAALKVAEPVLRRLLASADAQDTVVAGVAVGVPGRVDGAGRVWSRELRWTDVELSRLLTQRLETLTGGVIPVTVHNGFQLAALAEEWFGGTEPVPGSLLVVGGELSVGAGFSATGDSAVWPEAFAGELGHLRIRRSGDRCDCGARGCLDTIAGPRALARALDGGAAASRLCGGGSRLRALARSDRAGPVLRRAVTALGDALAGTVAMLEPEHVILGGHFTAFGAVFAEQLSEELRNLHPGTAVAVSGSRLTGDAVARAAAASITRRLVEEPARWLGS